jgi:hypothetical protein
MKKIILILAVLFTGSVMQAQVFIIERGSNSFTYNNIKSAVDALEDNDRLYLPPCRIELLREYTGEGYPGLASYTHTIIVNKKVSIFGAGYADGANSTVISSGGRFVLGNDADESYLSGIRFECSLILDTVSNCIISRCQMAGTLELGVGNNIVITECEINNQITGLYASGYSSSQTTMPVTYSKCIFDYSSLSLYYATVNNSIFLLPILSRYGNSTLSNNIFVFKDRDNYKVNISNGYNNFSHNLWVGAYPESDDITNVIADSEITNEPYENVFVNATAGNFHLKPECSGKNAGADGTDVGIYGTTTPFKESRLPSSPHFKEKYIAPETNNGGNLPVHIVVEAQTN